jgi:hypothetical protein
MAADEATHVISLCSFNSNKKYREKTVSEITKDICAMLNVDGGKVLLHNDCQCNDDKVLKTQVLVKKQNVC